MLRLPSAPAHRMAYLLPVSRRRAPPPPPRARMVSRRRASATVPSIPRACAASGARPSESAHINAHMASPQLHANEPPDLESPLACVSMLFACSRAPDVHAVSALAQAFGRALQKLRLQAVPLLRRRRRVGHRVRCRQRTQARHPGGVYAEDQGRLEPRGVRGVVSAEALHLTLPPVPLQGMQLLCATDAYE